MKVPMPQSRGGYELIMAIGGLLDGIERRFLIVIPFPVS
jgi:hypothetical protein